MLSISPPIQNGEYYLSLGREDYYLEGGEPPGLWVGLGAGALGLAGQVDPEDLRNLMLGFSPDGAESLVQSAGRTEPDRRGRNPQRGWDLTFSAPKSVSVLWSQADQATRKAIQEAHHRAVSDALSYLEDVAGYCRAGKGGGELVRAKLIVATFEHGTSRAQDPQLHTHAVVVNIGVREDGKTRTLYSKSIFQHKMAAGALYRAALSAYLERDLRLRSEPDRSSFRLCGVPNALVSFFSKRRAEIEAALDERGLEGAKAAKLVALTTRTSKEHRPRGQLFEHWRASGKEHGWSTKEALALSGGSRTLRPRGPETAFVIGEALRSLTAAKARAEKSFDFTERELVRFAAENAQGRGLAPEQLLPAIRSELQHSSDIRQLASRASEALYTTSDLQELSRETGLLRAQLRARAEASKNEGYNHPVRARTLEKVIDHTPALGENERAELFQLTSRPGSLQVLAASARKDAVLSVAAQAWQRDGYTVIGCARSRKPSAALEAATGIESATLEKTLREAERWLADKPRKDWRVELAYATHQISKKHRDFLLGRRGKTPGKLATELRYRTGQMSRKERDYHNWTRERQRFNLGKKTIIVLDGAEKVTTRELALLTTYAEETGAKVVLSGETRGAARTPFEDIALEIRPSLASSSQAEARNIPERTPTKEPEPRGRIARKDLDQEVSL